MQPHLARRLLALVGEISAADSERRMLRERLASQRALLDELRVRTFIAETPHADRDFHVAADDLRRVEGRLAEIEIQLGALRAEERRLTATTASAEGVRILLAPSAPPTS